MISRSFALLILGGDMSKFHWLIFELLFGLFIFHLVLTAFGCKPTTIAGFYGVFLGIAAMILAKTKGLS